MNELLLPSTKTFTGFYSDELKNNEKYVPHFLSPDCELIAINILIH